MTAADMKPIRQAAAAPRIRRRAQLARRASSFANLKQLDVVGIYPNYAEAYKAWKARGAAHRRQRHDALLHRPHAPPSRSRRHGRRRVVTLWPPCVPERAARRMADAAS